MRPGPATRGSASAPACVGRRMHLVCIRSTLAGLSPESLASNTDLRRVISKKCLPNQLSKCIFLFAVPIAQIHIPTSNKQTAPAEKNVPYFQVSPYVSSHPTTHRWLLRLRAPLASYRDLRRGISTMMPDWAGIPVPLFHHRGFYSLGSCEWLRKRACRFYPGQRAALVALHPARRL
jgi:hypothetical protein